VPHVFTADGGNATTGRKSDPPAGSPDSPATVVALLKAIWVEQRDTNLLLLEMLEHLRSMRVVTSD
jgi:hypothetical protein